MAIPSHSQIMAGFEQPEEKRRLPTHEEIMSGVKQTQVEPTPVPKIGLSEPKTGITGGARKLASGALRFAARTGVEAANLASSTIDFIGDFVAGKVEERIRRPGMTVGPTPLQSIPVGKETEFRGNLANKWAEFYENTAGKGTEEIKAFTAKLRENEFIQPSEEWRNASLKDKLSTKLPETVLNIGPGVVASLGSFALNPALGFTLASGSVADDIKTTGIEGGLNEEKAELLGLGTGLLVGWIDKVVPDELFSPQQKREFLSGIAKRVMRTGLKEAGTEVAQEDVQIMVEATLREDLTLDEVVERNAMAGLGGLLGGSGSQTIVSFLNNIKSGDIGGITEEDIQTFESQESMDIEDISLEEAVDIDVSGFDGVAAASATVQSDDTAIITIDAKPTAQRTEAVTELENQLKERGVTEVKLMADDDTAGIYAQLGYKVMGRTSNGVVPMVKPLELQIEGDQSDVRTSEGRSSTDTSVPSSVTSTTPGTSTKVDEVLSNLEARSEPFSAETLNIDSSSLKKVGNLLTSMNEDSSELVELYSKVREVTNKYDSVISTLPGNPEVITDIKKPDNLLNKVVRFRESGREEYSIQDVNDVLRGRAVYESEREIMAAVEEIGDTPYAKDYFKDPHFFGYRGHHKGLNIDGVKAEIQVHTKRSLTLDEVLRPVYEKYRGQDSVPLDIIERVRKASDDFYDGKIEVDEANSIIESIVGGDVRVQKGIKRDKKELSKTESKQQAKTIKLQEPPSPKKKVFKIEDRQQLQSQVADLIDGSRSQEDAIKQIDQFTVDQLNNVEDPLYDKKLKAIRAEFRRKMFEIAGVDTGNWKRDYAFLQAARNSPEISDVVDRLEDAIYQIDEAVNTNAPSSSLGYATMGSIPIGKFEQRQQPKRNTREFKMYQEVQGLIRKYAQSIGEGYLPRKALGVYYNKTKNIRINAINNLSTAAHEITHFLDTKFQITDKLMAISGYNSRGNPIYDRSTLKYRKEITDLYTKYYAGGKKGHPLRKRAREGFATLLQKYVESPQRIANEYPLLVKDFLQEGGRFYQPVMEEILQDLNTIVDEYQGLSALDKIGSKVTSDKINADKPSFMSLRDKIRTFLADEIYPVEVIAQKAGKHLTQEDPSLWLRAYRSINGVIGNNVSTDRGYWTIGDSGIRKVYDFNWKTLVDLTNERRVTDDFAYYLVARREYFSYQELDALQEKVDEAKKVMADMTEEEALTLVDENGQTAVDKFKEARENYRRLKTILDNDGFTRKEVDEAYEQNKDRFTEEEQMFDQLTKADLEFMASKPVQLITREQFKELSSKQGYASFKREFYDDIVGDNNDITGVAKVGKTKVSSLIRRKGSERTIINPLYNGITNHSEIMRKGTKQIVYNKMTNIGVSAMFPNLFQELDLGVAVDGKTGVITFPQEKDPNIIMGRLNYKRKPVLVDSEVKAAIDSILTYENIDTFVKLYTGLSRLFTAGTTGFYPQFTATNLLRDQITAQANTTNKYKALYSPLKTFGELIQKKDSDAYKYYQEYMIMGGERQTFTGWQKLPPRHLFKRISQEKSALERAITVGEKTTDVLSTPAKYSEIITRVSEYINARRDGKPPIVALEEAGRLSAPFHHIGTWGGKHGQTYIRGLPFFNAGIQVLDQAARVASTPDGRRRMGFVTLAITASYLASILKMIDADDEQIEQYKDLHVDELAGFIHVPHPSGSKLIRIPMSNIFTPLGTIINMVIADRVFGTKYKPSDYMEASIAWIPDQFDITEPVRAFLSWIPQVFKAGTETVIGVKTWPEVTPLEGMSLKNLPPGMRSNENTSKFAKWLGKKINISPIKIDYLITGYLGRATGLVTGKPSAWDWDSSIIRDYWFSYGRRVDGLYDLKEENEQKYNAYQRGDLDLTDEVVRDTYRVYVLSNTFTEIMRDYREVDIEKEQEKAADIRNEALQIINMIENGDEPTREQLPKTYRSFEGWLRAAKKRRKEKISEE